MYLFTRISLIMVIFVTLSLVNVAISTPSSSPSDRAALIDFYTATNGASWSNTWPVSNPLSDHCTWTGVYCIDFGDNIIRVYFLSLVNNNLQGTLPDSLGNLTQLVYLYLNNNYLGGTINPVLGNLTHLSYVQLDHNQFYGTLPPVLAFLPSLYGLSVNDNLLYGNIAQSFSNYENGQFYSYQGILDIANNNFCGYVPELCVNHPTHCDITKNLTPEQLAAFTLPACTNCFDDCATKYPGSVCYNGQCLMVNCPSGFSDCDEWAGNGCETLGECIVPHVFEVYAPKSYHLVCNSGLGDCNYYPNDGCETNLTTSSYACGSCNTNCYILTGVGSASCVASKCKISQCAPGCLNIDKDDSNGCEVCGTIPVPGGYLQVDHPYCRPFYDNCNGDVRDGCEVDVRSDPLNCNGCGQVCANAPNLIGSCVNGKCGTACPPQMLDCNNDLSDGCETSNSSIDNCGGCSISCMKAHVGNATCSNGKCSIVNCIAPYRDCNTFLNDGCEINTNVNVGNCGACGKICSLPNATPICSLGVCKVGTCNAGWCNANNQAADGCEKAC